MSFLLGSGHFYLQVVLLSTIFSAKIAMSRLRTPKSDSDEGPGYESVTDDDLSCDGLSLADMSSDVDSDVCPDSPSMSPSGKPAAGLEAVPDLYNGNAHPASFYIEKMQRFRLDPELKDKYKRKKYAHRTTKGLAGVKY